MPSDTAKRKEFNREMLILARESRGMNRAELAHLCGISGGRIINFETGMSIPSGEEIDALAKATEYLTPFFFLGERIRGITPCKKGEAISIRSFVKGDKP